MIFTALLLLLAKDDCASPADDTRRLACAQEDLQLAENRLVWVLERSRDNAKLNDEKSPPAASDETRVSQLEAAQTRWLAYREAHCASVYLAPVAAKLEPVNRIWCLTRMTKQRSEELSLPFITD